MPELALLPELVVQADFTPRFRRLVRANARKYLSDELRFDARVPG